MYLSWNEKTITDFSTQSIEAAYNEGYVFTRIGKGIMNQTRTLRIDLGKFKLSSENKRVLKKIEALNLTTPSIPYDQYDWTIHKMGKEFYEKKFGEKTFSAQKIKELIVDKEKSNFNTLFVYHQANNPIGYCIALETEHIAHYCYPFYDLSCTLPNIGMSMMLRAIIWAQEHHKKYMYLGSAQRPSDTYKMQFSGLEWFDGQQWNTDTEALKNILHTLIS